MSADLTGLINIPNYRPHPSQIAFFNRKEDVIFFGGGQPVRVEVFNPDLWRRTLSNMPKYPIDGTRAAQLANSYTYHSPFGDQPERYVTIRNAAHEFARVICENSPQSREQSIALTDLEKVVTMVNKAIACNEKPET